MAENEKEVIDAVKTTGSEAADAVLAKAKGFWGQYSKPIIYVGGAIILLSAGWLAYKYMYKLPNEEKANVAIIRAEKIFDKMSQDGSYTKDSVNLVLNGGQGITGVTKVISNYGGTAAGNRANLMAARCYLENKEFDKAVKAAKAFNSNGDMPTEISKHTILGHAYSELKKNEDAFDAYEKAATTWNTDDAENGLAADATLTAATFAARIGKTKDAISLFKTLRDKFPKTQAAQEVDKYLAKLGVLD